MQARPGERAVESDRPAEHKGAGGLSDLIVNEASEIEDRLDPAPLSRGRPRSDRMDRIKSGQARQALRLSQTVGESTLEKLGPGKVCRFYQPIFLIVGRMDRMEISDHPQSRWYEEGPWKGPSSLVALARSLVADWHGKGGQYRGETSIGQPAQKSGHDP